MVAIVEAARAVEAIGNGDTVLFGGSGGGHGVAEAVIEALADRFRETGEPRDLTLMSVVSLGDWESAGFGRLALPGLARRVISAGLNNCPAFARMAADEAIEAYLLPQGVLSQVTRDMAAGRPGLLTTVGLHTFVDPRLEGGRQNARSTDSLVELVTVGDEEYLLYRALPIDVAVIRGTTVDEEGNLSAEEEAYSGELLSIAAAARRRGGVVIAQAKRLAKAGTLHGKAVKVPGALVDYVVEAPSQRQTYQTDFDPAYAGIIRRPTTAMRPLPFDIRKVIARRAAMELAPGDLVNLGFGVSNGISLVAVEEGFMDDITLTVEQGIFGGVTAGGKDAGAGVNFHAMLDQSDNFDFYDGGGLDIAFLSFAQVDAEGNVNVSRYGGLPMGSGGFINISQGTRRVVFSGTLTTGGLEVAPNGRDGVAIAREGRVRKWMTKVDQVTFSGRYARERGQQVTFVTDRAVLELRPEGITLVEIADGVDLQRDVLDQIEFEVRVAPTLRAMDPRLFRDAPMGLLAEFRQRARRRGHGETTRARR
ncbi:MAG: 3-oxoacid CoA-transferase [Chromatiales bacterium]|nr:3-oxoacid CoA-transferase [Chromatiales bacterium]